MQRNSLSTAPRVLAAQDLFKRLPTIQLRRLASDDGLHAVFEGSWLKTGIQLTRIEVSEVLGILERVVTANEH
jgi:hypothetical protein